MPEDTDLIVDENADSAESLNKSKHFMDLSSNKEELKTSQMNTSMKKKISTKTKTKQEISLNDMISSEQLSAKEVLCNRKTRSNGYTKSIAIKHSIDNNDNESKIIIKELKEPVNGHEADETDTEEEKGIIRFTSIFIN